MTNGSTTYATRAPLLDADSHLMESHDWLQSHADDRTRQLLADLSLGEAGADAPAHIRAGLARIDDADAVAELEEDVMGSAKGWLALGAMSAGERSRALDLIGLDAQLVFSTFAATQFAFSRDPELAFGGAAAHNRGIVEFCSGDGRLLPVGLVPLTTVAGAIRCLDEAIDMGCAAIWVPHGPAEGRSPAHLDMEPFWARLAEAGIPFVLHVGGGKMLSAVFHDNGRPVPPDFVGGGENVRAKDFPSLHHSAESFLSTLVLDGVFDRFENLRCGVIELGASWVPGMLARLDSAKAAFGRNEPLLAELALDPSEYVRRQIRFTPFPFDDVGWAIAQSHPELYLFSTDYPHPEGTRDPLGRFEKFLDGHGTTDGAREAFYHGNFRTLFGGNPPWEPARRSAPTSGAA